MHRSKRFYLPVLLYAIVILGLSSLSQSDIRKFAPDLRDTILHFIEYNGFGVTWLWFYLADRPLTELKSSYRHTIFSAIPFAMLDEYYQSFIPTRDASLHDLAADVAGVILSLLTFWILLRIPALRRLREDA